LITTLPEEMDVRIPLFDIFAMLDDEEAQITELETSSVLESEYVAVTASCRLLPVFRFSVKPLIVSESKIGGGATFDELPPPPPPQPVNIKKSKKNREVLILVKLVNKRIKVFLIIALQYIDVCGCRL